MYFGVAGHQLLLAAFSLEPGDVIATGTPGGVGIFRDRLSPDRWRRRDVEIRRSVGAERCHYERATVASDERASGAFPGQGALGCIGAGLSRLCATVRRWSPSMWAATRVAPPDHDARRARGCHVRDGDITDLAAVERSSTHAGSRTSSTLRAPGSVCAPILPARLVNVVARQHLRGCPAASDAMAPVVYTSSMAVYTADDADPVTVG